VRQAETGRIQASDRGLYLPVSAQGTASIEVRPVP
jgi:hypothetical protein